MSSEALRTVAVLGGSYGGRRAAQVLAAGLPNGWRVVLVDRNSHFNHVYSLSRYTVLPGHEHKAFIPYDHLFDNVSDSHPHKRVHGAITSLYPYHLTYIPLSNSSSEATEETLHFDYAIYALGSHLPSPINLWESRDAYTSFSGSKWLAHGDSEDPQHIDCPKPYKGMKQEGIFWLRARQQKIAAANTVLVVGGGALGIQFASDTAAVFPRKSVTLVHSRSKLLHRFDEALGDEAYQGLQDLGVHVIFNERLDMSSFKDCGDGNEFRKQETVIVKTVKGREMKADLVLLCTGQMPNTSLVRDMDLHAIDPESGMVRVSRTMQILAQREKSPTGEDHSLNRIAHAHSESSLTLCGTAPPSPVDTVVELGSTVPVPRSEIVAEPEFGASHDLDTFVYPHLFAIGDAADAFGAIKAGYTAYYQGELAARNVIRLIKRNEMAQAASLTESVLEKNMGNLALDAEEDIDDALELEEYAADLPMIKVSLGLTKSAYEVAGVVGTKDDGTDDLGANVVWRALGYKDIDEEGMWG